MIKLFAEGVMWLVVFAIGLVILRTLGLERDAAVIGGMVLAEGATLRARFANATRVLLAGQSVLAQTIFNNRKPK